MREKLRDLSRARAAQVIGGPFKIGDDLGFSPFLDEPPTKTRTLTAGTWLVWCGAKQMVVRVPPGTTQKIAAALDAAVDNLQHGQTP